MKSKWQDLPEKRIYHTPSQLNADHCKPQLTPFSQYSLHLLSFPKVRHLFKSKFNKHFQTSKHVLRNASGAQNKCDWFTSFINQKIKTIDNRVYIVALNRGFESPQSMLSQILLSSRIQEPADPKQLCFFSKVSTERERQSNSLEKFAAYLKSMRS